MLHDARHEDLLTVADGVHLQLLAHDVAVHQHGAVGIDLYGGLEVVAQRLLIRDDLHGTSAEHVARAHQHRIADPLGGPHALFDIGHRLGFGLGNTQLLHDLLEAAAVLGIADGLDVGAHDGHAQRMERLGEVDGRLTAQRHDDSLRLLEGG